MSSNIDLNRAYGEDLHMHTHYCPAEALALRTQDIIKKETGTIIPWGTIAEAIYTPLIDLAHTINVGDTIELPNGATLIVAYKPGTKV